MNKSPMIHSMTGFARRQHQSAEGTLVWEVRSVNHRYLDCQIRLPDGFVEVEAEVRQYLGAQLQRGRVDATLYFHAGEASMMHVNKPLAEFLMRACHTAAKTSDCVSQVNLMDVLTYPEVLYWENKHMHAKVRGALALLKEAVADVVMMRAQEGRVLQEGLHRRLELVRGVIANIEALQVTGRSERKARFLIWKEELEFAVEPQRWEQAMIAHLQKFDIAEELERLAAHIQAVEGILQTSGVVGRRLDFLMQEMNREINTLAAKAVGVQISQAAIEVKVLIEQMREQIQNVL